MSEHPAETGRIIEWAVCRCDQDIYRDPFGKGWRDEFGSLSCGGAIDGGLHAPRGETR